MTTYLDRKTAYVADPEERKALQEALISARPKWERELVAKAEAKRARKAVLLKKQFA
jgi:hypothetical protein